MRNHLLRATRTAGILVAVAVMLLFPTFTCAQIDTGSIVGTVSDPSGAAIAGATVELTNEATGVTRSVTTNNDGAYQFTAVTPGTYSVKASSSSFEAAIHTHLDVDVQSRPAIDFTLKVGSSTETVEVSSITPVLQTESADMGGVVQAEQINDLPLNGRRYSDLALLEAGIQRNLTNTNNTAPDRFSSNGNLETQNYFSLDGIDNNSGSTNLQESSVQVIQPPPDALEEFRIQTRTYSSEFGTSAGAVINASIKSGTNQFHGDLWEFLRNDVLDANRFENKSSPNVTPRGHFTQNQYGATIGGPIIKNRTFFFGDFQIFSSRKAATIQSTVPTPLMKTGNFTELKTALTDSPVAGQAGCVVANVISPSCIDPTAAQLIALFPDPNYGDLTNQGLPGNWTGGANYQFQAAVPNDTKSFDVRIDHTLNNSNHIFGRYSQYIIKREDPPWTSDPVAGNGNFATAYNIHERSIALSWVHTFRPNLLNEARFGFNRDYAHSDPVGLTLGKSLASQFGLTGIPDGPNTAGIPPIEIAGLQRLGTSPWRPQFQISQVWQFLDNLSWLKGNHSFKFGYESRRMSNNFFDIRAPQGDIGVNGIYTAGDGGFGVADFLLGDVDSVLFTTPTVVHNYVIGNSLYAQDTWRLRPNLTVTYGLRYELFSPLLNHQNELSNFSPDNGGEIITADRNASGWFNRALVHPDKNDFAPRLGFSYHPFERVVLRGGYGIFYQHTVRIGSESILALNPPAVISYGLSQLQGTNTPEFQLQDGFPIDRFTSTDVVLSQIQIRAQDPNERSGYVQQFSFGPEIQLMKNTSLDIGYVGNLARKMNRLRNANQGFISGTDAGGNPIVDFPFANLNDSTTGNHSFLELATNDGNSDYNALLVSLRHRYTGGLSYGLSYTWSHNIADYVDNLTGGAFPQNAYNYAAERGDSMFDVRHRIVGYVTYELPFGHGKRMMDREGPINYILGGWQVNSIVTAQTGTTIQLNAQDHSGTGASISRPDCIGNARSGASDDPRSGAWLNAAAFAEAADGTFGNCGVGRYHGPGLTNMDLSIFKAFPIRESMRFEFRAEAFNAFNHANFSNPNSFFAPFTIGPGGSFGVITSTVGDPREFQFALKFYF